jgi:hypothetical protein
VTWLEARERVLAATPSHVAQFSPINLGFQVIGLLYGDDFGDAICKTVNCGYDTDSSGGTIGSWLGILQDADELPERWTEPFGEGISTNESWGGVRHLSNGRRSMPQTVPELVARIVAMARRLLAAEGALQDGATVQVDAADLYADESVMDLWARSPHVIEHPGNGLDVAVDYGDGPAVGPDSTKVVTTRLANRRPDPVELTATMIVPEGGSAPEPQHATIAANSSAELTWALPVPSAIENSNRLFLSCELAGYPQSPAVPIALVGSTALAVAGPFPVNGAGEDEVLRGPLPRQLDWRELSAPGNRVPLEHALGEPGVAYVRTYFEAAEPLEVTLGVDASGPVAAWLNGGELFSACRRRPIRPAYAGHQDGYQVVPLKAGFNELLVRLVRGEGDPVPECHVVISSGDRLRNGLPQVGRTRFPAS